MSNSTNLEDETTLNFFLAMVIMGWLLTCSMFCIFGRSCLASCKQLLFKAEDDLETPSDDSSRRQSKTSRELEEGTNQIKNPQFGGGYGWLLGYRQNKEPEPKDDGQHQNSMQARVA